jgi:hypothetical protein
MNSETAKHWLAHQKKLSHIRKNCDHTTQSLAIYSSAVCSTTDIEQSYAMLLWIKTSIFQQILQIEYVN